MWKLRISASYIYRCIFQQQKGATKGLGCRRESSEGGFVSGTCTGVDEETKRNETKGETSDGGMGDDVTAGDG